MRCLSGPEPAVSGSDTRGLDGQNPAESREFLGLYLDAGAKSLQQQTGWRSEWDSNLQYCSAEPRPSLGRIESETEPPNLATETNAGCGVFQARNPQSPVRIRERLAAKTPRNRGDFSGCARVRAGNLRNGRLSGGESGIRTHGTLSGTHAFQACAFNHSAISPKNLGFSARGARGPPRSNAGGEGGIRTLDELLTHTPLAGERLQPLGHLSVKPDFS